MAKEAWYLNESEADDYQIQIIRKNLQSSFIVKGCAGSGKTVLALWRAAELDQSGENDYLIIVFTRALKQFIMDGITHIGLDSSKVMYHWQWKDAGFPSADYIIVDEVQDFDEEEIFQIQNAANKHLILFGDSAQQIYAGIKENLLTMEQIHLTTRVPIENLVINHRLPKKIARVAQIISNSQDQLVERCKKEGVNKPRLIKCSSYDDQLNYIKDVVVSNEYTDVGILFPSNDDVKSAYNYYTKIGWNVERKDGYGRGAMNLNFGTDNPKLMTYHSAKGLQFEAVFLPNFQLENKNLNARYVAITRSYRDLFVLYAEVTSPFDGIVEESLIEIIDAIDYKKDVSDVDDDLPF